ncbi:protein PRRC1-A-like isoform X2 [Gigantopelta aegis]|uniref:protein PRRC1-A-like isoform X2 n=1 Tax=Gigantopelta aegis TaxID=1735272 RepID=UPI001B88B4EA|nr:protein PRRC1-A-like isoform X2 [Gigantopelta aegis]
MMSESSDEQPEIVTLEEAQLAEKEASELSGSLAAISTPVASPAVGSVPAPSPLPTFMTKTPETATAAQMAVTQQTPITSPTVAQMSSRTPVSSSVTPSRGSGGVVSLEQITTSAPGPIQTPYEASSSIPITQEQITPPPESPAAKSGLFSWISGNSFMNKVVEKTKSSVESVITTLDPGMKEIIRSGGDIEIVVTSTKESKLGAVREAFQQVFGRATVSGKESQATTAAQPVGFTAGLKGAEERIQNLRQSGQVEADTPVVSIEGFIVEMLTDRWYEMSCIVLQDPGHRIELQTFSQPTPIPTEYILMAQDKTPSTYPLRWSGLAATIGQVIEEAQPHIGHTDWHSVMVGVNRRESLMLAARVLAYMYQQRLPTSFIS